jgi:hypothetical protein
MKQESPFQARIDTEDTMRTRWHRGSKRSKTRSTGSLLTVTARLRVIPRGGGELP